MADLSLTAASIVATSTATKMRGIAGDTITAGMSLYYDSTTSKYKKADASSADAATLATVVGIALNAASDGQPLWLLTEGNLTTSSSLTIGTIYVCSANAGGIAPSTDLVSTDYVSVIGVATTATNLLVNITNSGIKKP